jgi:2-oxoglutarate ferredoxin oxidoreductase subunit gamma
VISGEPIKFPHVILSDILVALSQSAYDKYIGEVPEQDALVIYDDMLVTPQDRKGIRQVGVPATNTAIRELKRKQVANIVIFGVSVALTGIVTKEAVVSAINENIDERFKELNTKAFEAGHMLGEKVEKGK